MTIEMRKLTEAERAACKGCSFQHTGHPSCSWDCTRPVDPNLTYADYMREWEEQNVTKIEDVQLPKQSNT